MKVSLLFVSVILISNLSLAATLNCKVTESSGSPTNPGVQQYLLQKTLASGGAAGATLFAEIASISRIDSNIKINATGGLPAGAPAISVSLKDASGYNAGGDNQQGANYAMLFFGKPNGASLRVECSIAQ